MLINLRSTFLLTFTACFALSASADTLVVDDDGGPGVDFVSVQDAVNAAAPGDLLLVYPGSYGQVYINKTLNMQSMPTSNLAGLTIIDLPADGGACVSGVQLDPSADFEIRNCAGAVLLDQVGHGDPFDYASSLAQGTLSVHDCVDVRVQRSIFHAITATNSRIEFAESHAWAQSEQASGVSLQDSKVHLALSHIQGAHGSQEDSCECAGAANGGAGAYGCGELIVSGPVGGGVLGGRFGDCCFQDATQTYTLNGTTGADIQSTQDDCLSVRFSSPSSDLLTPDPTLGSTGEAFGGQDVIYHLRGQPGATAVLLIGFDPLVLPLNGQVIEDLLLPIRAYQPGQIPANGVLDFVYPIPSNLSQGTPIIAQFEVTRTDGEVLRTNSTYRFVR